jgi:hypothetical protein
LFELGALIGASNSVATGRFLSNAIFWRRAAGEAGDLKLPATLENFCMVFRLKKVEGEMGKFYKKIRNVFLHTINILMNFQINLSKINEIIGVFQV